MEEYKIALAGGDTIGPELIRQVEKIFRALELIYPVRFKLQSFSACGPAIEKYGEPLPASQAEQALECRGILIGNIGDSRYSGLPYECQPTQALLQLRRRLGVCTNLRRAYIHEGMESFSPLKRELIGGGVDILIVRDLMGGMITGPKKDRLGSCGREASDMEYYNERMIEFSAALAFAAARERRGSVTSVDKANVLLSGRLWREKVSELAKAFSHVKLVHDYVDHVAMDVLCRPSDYDVLLTSNLFGDILADEIAQLCGAPWLFGSGEIAADGRGLYTPNQLHHPKGREMENKGQVSPYCIIDASAMLLRHSLGREDLANTVEEAVDWALSQGLAAAEGAMSCDKIMSTDAIGDAVANHIKAGAPRDAMKRGQR